MQTQTVVQNSFLGNFELQGTKLQLRAERRVQALYVQVLAARVIQRRYRGHRARKEVMHTKLQLIVVYIQSYVRMFLAKEKKRRLLEAKYSVTVQKYLRRYLAKKCYFRLLSDAYDQMKLHKV